MMRLAVMGPIPLTFWRSDAEALLILILAVLGAVFGTAFVAGADIVLGVLAITVRPLGTEAVIPAKTGAASNKLRPLEKARTLFENSIWCKFWGKRNLKI
jgi:hypothetical protein